MSLLPSIAGGAVVAFLSVKCFKMWMQGPRCQSKKRLDGKIVVVTGANTGIGKVCAQELSKRGAKVFMLCRSLERGEAAAQDIRGDQGEILVEKMDLSSFRSIRECAEKLNHDLERIDILLNNAGVMACPLNRTEDGLEMQIGTNHFGHFLLTDLLLPLLRKGGPGTRIVNVSSTAHERGQMYFDDINFNKIQYEPFKAYSQSKLATVLFSAELAEREAKNGIHVYSLHPGVIATDLGRHMGDSYGAIVGVFYNWFVMPFIKVQLRENILNNKSK